MTPQQLLAQLGRAKPAPAYLFLGPEGFSRRRCRQALMEKILPAGAAEDAVVRHDLDELALDDVIDDARCLSLFAAERFVWVDSAESALPKGRASSAEDDDGDSPALKKTGGAASLADYLRQPTEGTVLVFNARKYDFEGEDKAKLERVRKFYAAVPVVVEFPRLGLAEARRLAQELAKEADLRIVPEALELLLEATAADALRLSNEIEKLRLYAGAGATVSEEQVARLVPSARSATVFQLVNALALKRRDQALDLLDTLVSEGEYLPLVLTFLASTIRLALVAREKGLRSPQMIQSYFSGQGVAMWRARAEQLHQTVTAFSQDASEHALVQIFEADKGLRESRPDDRVIMERFVMELTR